MKLIEKVKVAATTTNSKHLFIELACLAVFIDKKSRLAEQDFIKHLLKLQTRPEERLEAHYHNTMSLINRNNFNFDEFLMNTTNRFENDNQRTIASELLQGLFANEKNIRPESEALLLNKILETIRVPTAEKH